MNACGMWMLLGALAVPARVARSWRRFMGTTLGWEGGEVKGGGEGGFSECGD